MSAENEIILSSGKTITIFEENGKIIENFSLSKDSGILDISLKSNLIFIIQANKNLTIIDPDLNEILQQELPFNENPILSKIDTETMSVWGVNSSGSFAKIKL